MPAGATYEPIATTTLASATNTVTFSSIPATYTDLVLISASAGATNSVNETLQFNADTGSNYSRTRLGGNGTSADSGRNTSTTYITINYWSYPETTLGKYMSKTSIFNYAGSTNKTTLSESANAATGVDRIVGLWRSTSAINRIDITSPGGAGYEFKIGSTFTLYGIKSA